MSYFTFSIIAKEQIHGVKHIQPILNTGAQFDNAIAQLEQTIPQTLDDDAFNILEQTTPPTIDDALTVLESITEI